MGAATIKNNRRKDGVEMISREEFKVIANKKRRKQDVEMPSSEVWQDIKKVFDACEELFNSVETLQKCYAVTNDSWKKLQEENKQFRATLNQALDALAAGREFVGDDATPIRAKINRAILAIGEAVGE